MGDDELLGPGEMQVLLPLAMERRPEHRVSYLIFVFVLFYCR